MGNTERSDRQDPQTIEQAIRLALRGIRFGSIEIILGLTVITGCGVNQFHLRRRSMNRGSTRFAWREIPTRHRIRTRRR